MTAGLGELGSVECHGAVVGITQHEVGCALPCQSTPGFFPAVALGGLLVCSGTKTTVHHSLASQKQFQFKAFWLRKRNSF